MSANNQAFTVTMLLAVLPTVCCQQADWPDCPAKGCTPCPFYSDGRPNCTCFEGYSLNGQPRPGGGRSALVWDKVQGWVGTCQPVACGKPPHPAQSSVEKSGDEITAWMVYPQNLIFLCNVGYHVEGFQQDIYSAGVSQEDTSSSPSSIAFNSPSADNATTIAPSGSDVSRLMRIWCMADGTFGNSTGLRCEPICGDGRLVPTDHLPMYDPREQCDDGNSQSGDGCSRECRVEPGHVCTGGSLTSADACQKAFAFATGSLVISITGARRPGTQEVALATLKAISKSLRCPERDLEIVAVTAVGAAETNLVGSTTSSTTIAGSAKSLYHFVQARFDVQFKIKVSDPKVLPSYQIGAELETPQVFLPKVMVAYMQQTSLRDLYVTAVEVKQADVTGEEKPVSSGMSLGETLALMYSVAVPILSYLFVIGVVAPAITWFFRVRPREFVLMGHHDIISQRYKQGWVYNICGWTKSRLMCASLVCCLPARMAYTWDTVGVFPYWTGVVRAFMCFNLYVLGCWPCGACLVAGLRGNIRDFFGFGDGVRGNLELADVACYCCCPICSVIQEARHVDEAYRDFIPAFLESQRHARERNWSTQEAPAAQAMIGLPDDGPVII
eukprot:TRINITY_DN16699_c0_g2_i1.p1 TRINITY_DN16699_c0_g2~~TRINITY_DN16699_c0_g2_i1.p1  ORF type:complete len:613 (-),score=48.56 TRINITY_DN16699_c0_g2_i1:22-1860(-)